MFKSDQQITIGCIAVDLATGFEGTVTSRNDLFNGSVQYAVQPKAVPGSEKLPESYSFDEIGLRFKDKGISELAVEPQATDIQVGDKVEDVISGHRGVVTTKVTFLNGCVFFEVVKKGDEAKKIESSTMFVSASRLEKLLAEPVKPVTTATDKRPTGGPINRAFRAN